MTPVFDESARDLRPSSPTGVERSGSHWTATVADRGRTVAVTSAAAAAGRLGRWPRSRSPAAPRHPLASIRSSSRTARASPSSATARRSSRTGPAADTGRSATCSRERHDVDPARVFLTTGRPAGVRLLLRGAARAATGPGARRRPDLRPAPEAAPLAGRRRRGAADGRRGSRAGCARGGARARRRDLVPLHDSHVPEPERPHGRRAAQAAHRGALARARAGRARGRPLRPRAVRGNGPAAAPRPRGRRARHVHLVVLEDRRARAPRRLVRRPRGAGRARSTSARCRRTSRRRFSPRRSSTSSSSGRRSGRTWTGFATSSGSSATRCSPRSTTGSTAVRRGAGPRAATSCGSISSERVDAGDLLARATEAGVTFVRGADFFPDGLRRHELGAARVLLRDARADHRGRPHPRRPAVGAAAATAAGCATSEGRRPQAPLPAPCSAGSATGAAC